MMKRKPPRPGPGRPLEIDDAVTVTLRLPRRMRDLLLKDARAAGVTLAAQIRACLMRVKNLRERMR